MWMGGGYTGISGLSKIKDGVYQATFTMPNSVEGNGYKNVINIYTVPYNIVGISTIYKFKLEQGNKATDWTPAPEDVAQDATNKANAAQNNAINAASTDAAVKVTASQTALATQLGYSSYAEMAAQAAAGKTIINGGYINTLLIKAKAITSELIDVENLYVKNLDGANGTLGILTMKQGGAITLPPTFSANRSGSIDQGGINLVYQGSSSQGISWYSGMGTYAGKITCDNSGFLSLTSSFGVSVNNEFAGGSINIGTTIWTDVNIGNSGGIIKLAANKLRGMPTTHYVYNTISLSSASNYAVNIDTSMVIIASSVSGASIYRINNSYAENGAIIYIVNTTSNQIRIYRVEQNSSSNIRFSTGIGNYGLAVYGQISLIYYNGYWYLQNDWGQ